MPNNPLLPADILNYYQWSAQNGINPPQLPAGYVLATDPTTTGILALRLFDAAYITTGIIDPNRLGTGATGAGNLYLADDGTWKPVAGGGGGGDMLKVTYDVDNDGVVDSAERTEIIVRNSTGTTLTKGTVVYLSGATGNRPNALRAQADTEATSSKTIGIVVANINNNSDGYVATNGTLHDLDTSAFADGVAVWLSATTAGGITSTVPAEPNHAVFIGWIARSHPTAGRIVLHIQNGYELDEIHGVLLTSEANNDLLVYESSTNLWKNKTISAIFGGTPLVSVPTLAQVTTAGNTTTNAITVGSVNSNGNVVIGGASSSGAFQSYNGYYAFSFGTSVSAYNPNNNYTRIHMGASITYTDNFSGNFLWRSAGASVFEVANASVNFWNTSSVIVTKHNASTGNFLIGTTTDAGYKLDVNGTANVTTSIRVGAAGNTFTSITDSAFNISRTGDGALVVRLEGPTVLNATRSIGRITAREGVQLAYDTAPRLQVYSTTISIGIGAFDTNLGYDATSVLYVLGSKTASSAIARGVYFNNTLVAAANNDVLVGLDINPTFTNGAFTGVTNRHIRLLNSAASNGEISFGLLSGGGGYASSFIQDGTGLTIGHNSGSRILRFQTNATSRIYITGGGNVIVGSETDAGFKLDVVGADSRFNGVRVGLGAGGVSTNTVVGNGALALNTTGDNLIAIGSALVKNTTGVQNIGIGNLSLRENTTGSYNTAIGYWAGFAISTGSQNTIIGRYAGNGIATGSSNVAIGMNSLYNSATAPNDNVSIGTTAMQNGSGNNNIAIGTAALYNNTANNNTAVGYQAGLNNTTGTLNTLIGHSAGYNNTTAIGTTAVGHRALFTNSTGTENTAIGEYAMQANSTGNQNVSIGAQSMFVNSTGSDNTAIGYRSLQLVTSSNNTAIGSDSLQNTTTGGNNVAIGRQSLLLNTTGNCNTAIGFQAGQAGVANTTGTNNIFIGYQSTGVSATESNRTWIGNSSTTSTWLAGNVLIGTTTDAGYKLDVAGKIRTTGSGTNGVILYDGTYGAKVWSNGYIFTIEKEGTYGPTTYLFKYSDGSSAISLNGTTILGLGGSDDGVMMSRNVYARADAAFGFTSYGATTKYKAIQALFTDNSTSGVAFNYKTGGTDTEAMRINSAGNVLIGTTTNAAYKLDVNGDTRVSGSMTVNNRYLYHQGVSAIQYFMTSNAWSGTNTIFFGDDSSSTIGSITYNHQFDSLAFTVNGFNALHINSSRNVLIGTTTDAGYKLDVNGTARVQGAFTATLANVSTVNVVYYNSSTGLMTYAAAPIGAQFVIDYDPNITGTKNGVNLLFTTSATFIVTTTRVFLNGQRLTRGATYDYVETGTNQITFAAAPLPTDQLIIEYQI